MIKIRFSCFVPLLLCLGCSIGEVSHPVPNPFSNPTPSPAPIACGIPPLYTVVEFRHDASAEFVQEECSQNKMGFQERLNNAKLCFKSRVSSIELEENAPPDGEPKGCNRNPERGAWFEWINSSYRFDAVRDESGEEGHNWTVHPEENAWGHIESYCTAKKSKTEITQDWMKALSDMPETKALCPWWESEKDAHAANQKTNGMDGITAQKLAEVLSQSKARKK